MKIKSKYKMESTGMSNDFELSAKEKVHMSEREGKMKLLRSNVSPYNLRLLKMLCELSKNFGGRKHRRQCYQADVMVLLNTSD